MDVGAWLRGLGLEKYDELFTANVVGPDVLPDLTDADLKELGVPLGDRKRLLKAAATLRRAAADVAPARAAPVEEPPGERRQVAVLFADLAGYTALARELDAEELHDLLDGFFAVADRLIEEHGGTIDKHIGDCVMGVFGAPVAHGNDAERAVRAALAIRDAMPALAARDSPAGRGAHRRRQRPGRRERHRQPGAPDLHGHRRLGEPGLAPHRPGARRARSWSRMPSAASSPSGWSATRSGRSR